jgi:trimeric autotransporter adhesin
MKKLIIFKKLLFILPVFFLAAAVMAQNITNTLGPGGIFTIKDASNNLFTLNGSTGQVNILKTLRLENTTSSTEGVLYINNERFLHNYGGSSNTFIGALVSNFTLTGQFNTAVGKTALFSLTTGSKNSALGFASLGRNTSGADNSAFGHGTLSFNTTGNHNSAFGYLALRSSTTASWNSAFGYNSLVFNTTGIENSAFGSLALSTNSGGNWNSAFGMSSLEKATVNFNTAIGVFSGTSITTGSGVVCIGYGSEPSSGSVVNQLTLGSSLVTSLRCAVTTITSLSDARDKKNIKDLALGISFLMKIKPRLFNWDKREWYEDNISDGKKMEEAPTAGFISQELDEAQLSENAEWLRLVFKDNPEKLEAQAGNLMPIIVKAVQELKTENDRLKNQNSELKDKNKKYKKLLGDLKQIQDMLASDIEKMKLKSSVKEVNMGENQ